MQHTLESFLRALRANDVRLSPAEAIDAHRALAHVGYGDRQLLKDALCATLAKSADEVDRFDACFEAFFSRDALKASGLANAGEGGAAGEGATPLAEMLLSGYAAGLALAM